MAATASTRDLRNHFPRVKKLLDEDGEVIVTDRGVPRYLLTLYRSPKSAKAPPPKDYLARMRRHQPKPMSAADAAALDEANRGSR